MDEINKTKRRAGALPILAMMTLPDTEQAFL